MRAWTSIAFPASCRILENVAPDVPRILMSEVEVPEEHLEAFRRRVRGYVPTTLPINQVAEAIRFVVAGGTFIPLSILSMHRRPEPISKEPTLHRISRAHAFLASSE